jgi:choline dehydrogenase
MMLAEKAADLIAGNTPLPPQTTPYYRQGVSPLVEPSGA